jgi:hypothetical protein
MDTATAPNEDGNNKPLLTAADEEANPVVGPNHEDDDAKPLLSTSTPNPEEDTTQDVGGTTTSTTTTSSTPTKLAQRLLANVPSALGRMKTLLTTVEFHNDHWTAASRDHMMAFITLQGMFLIVSCFAYAMAFKTTLSGAISFLFYSVVWNWLGSGIIVALIGREIANRFCRQAAAVVQDSSSSTPTTTTSDVVNNKQTVEWLYAFDIHCNAFFPLFVVLCEFFFSNK